MITVRFSNELDQPLEFMVEPWGAVEIIPPGSRFAIHYPAPEGRSDTSYAEYHVGMIRFLCEGDTYEVDVDGERIGI
ncbi:hypothetical protein SAMN06295912_103233 [Sphingomonas laterariae]|uniref:Uncharacterized protein n=2 Tax=Edaphosphingomonas laterariae TaxID=861865 RepID=A0A239D5R7_9SPHN|nr:hypothetical protein SAMN06295912_103233 [Sphingomonas laterariae]